MESREFYWIFFLSPDYGCLLGIWIGGREMNEYVLWNIWVLIFFLLLFFKFHPHMLVFRFHPLVFVGLLSIWYLGFFWLWHLLLCLWSSNKGGQSCRRRVRYFLFLFRRWRSKGGRVEVECFFQGTFHISFRRTWWHPGCLLFRLVVLFL